MTKDERALLRTVRRLQGLSPEARRFVVRRLTMPEKRTLKEFWPGWAHEGQLPPPSGPSRSSGTGSAGTGSGDWPVWLMVTGRGFGKTRAGAEWVSGLARSLDPSTQLRRACARDERGLSSLRIALVGATIEDARKVMVTGVSGLLAVARTGEAVRFARTQGVVRFASGAEANLYSGACPEKLRGPEHHFAWCDEIAKWRYPDETWDNLQLGLRLGAFPKALVTTTPKSLPLLRRLVAAADVRLTRGRTADNPHLPPAFVARMEAEYGGTRKGREELDGELFHEAEGALWTRALIERCRVAAFAFPAPPAEGPEPLERLPWLKRHERPAPRAEGYFKRIVVGVDPPASAAGDACGIVACGLGADGVAYVLGDHSERGLSPEGWASKVATAAAGWGADCVIVESNQGGEMTTSVLKAADPAMPVRPAFARYGKGDRAEPVAMLFEKGEARFAGAFPELEDELCAMTRGGDWAGPGGSPDRADAMIWAMTELKLGGRAEPRVIGL